MPRSFLIKTKQQQQERKHDVTDDVTELSGGDFKANDDDVRMSSLPQHQSLPCDKLFQTDEEMIENERIYKPSSEDMKRMKDGRTLIDSRMDYSSLPASLSTQMASHCNVTLQSAAAAAAARSHLASIVTSSQPQSPLFRLYPDTLAWLRQLHAMCACADRPFPFPLPVAAAAAALPPRHCLATSPEPVYYVTKMAAAAPPMQPFDPRWASCPSPSTAPSVEVVEMRSVERQAGAGRTGLRGPGRDFSIPSILSGGGGSSSGSRSGSSTSADSESEDRCHSTPSSLDDEPRRHVVTSYDHVTRAPADPMSHQRRLQVDKQKFECPQCNKVYGTMGALKMHVRTHTLPCRCPLCGKAFSRPWLLQGHVRTHTGERPFQCPDCDRAFADRSNLRAHLQTHAGVKRYRCQTCNKPFSRMSLLAKHQDSAACRLLI